LGVPTAVAPRLVEAIAAQDPAAIARCFTETAGLRALTPPGLRERAGSADSAALIAAWFADATVLELVESGTEEVADRLHVFYRFEGVEDGEPFVVEQHLYCTLADDGRIDSADLLCSGFLPRS